MHRRRTSVRAARRRAASWQRRVAWLGPALLAAVAACGGGAPLPPETIPASPRAEVAPVIADHMPDRSKLPEPTELRDWAPPEPQTWTLNNGIRVWYLEQGPTPLVSVMLVGLRGAAADPVKKIGLTELTADMLDEGAAGKSALEISELLQELATDYSAVADVDHVLLSMHLMADTFDRSVGLLADMVRRPAFPKAEFKRRKDHRIAQALANEAQASHARAVVTRKALFGDGYAGELPSGTRRTLPNIGLNDVKSHYKNLFAPDTVELVVVGGIGAEAVKDGLEAAFGDWKGKGKAEPASVAQQQPEAGVYLVDFPDAPQSSLAVARRAAGSDAPDYFPAMIYNRQMGGAFSSRLNLNLREDKGYTYGARSLFRRWRNVGYFGLFTDVKTETTRSSVEESFKELAAFCQDRPLTQEERDDAVNGLLLGFPGRFEHVSTVAARFATLPVLQRPADWFVRWPERVRAVTLEDANRVAARSCDPKSYVVVIAGDRKKVEPELQSLGLPIIAYDAQGNRLEQ